MAQVDYQLIRRHGARLAKKLFDEFEKRKGVLLDVAKEFYPLGVAGLEKSVDNLADASEYDEDHRLLTTTPVDCLRKGAAGFHGNLTSPARRWFKMRLPSFMTEDGRTTHEQRAALDRLTEATEWVMQRSNIYASIYKLYEHLLCFGFGCMIVKGDAERIISATTCRIGTYALGIGADGRVNRVVRRFSWTAEEIISHFGDAGVTDEIKRAAEKSEQGRRWTVYNLIEPNAVGYMKAYDRVAQACGLSDDMVYRSLYWLESASDDTPNSGVLEISGFTIEPLVAPRFDYEIGDTYGRGRGIDGLDLARGIQSFEYDILKISGCRAQPAVIASAEFKDEGLKLGRGAVNYTRFGEQKGGMVVPALPNPPDSNDTRMSFEQARLELQDLFFNTAFATIDALKNQTGVKTATEVDALVRENMERLGPVVTNLDKELLDPLVSIVAKYTLQAGVAPMSPEDLSLFNVVNVEYVSQIHLAQKQSSISSVQSMVQFAGAVAQMKPEALDKIDVDATIDKFGEMVGVPEVCLTDDRAVEQVRAMRAQQMERQQQMQDMQAQAQAARDMGSIPTDENHAAGTLMQGLGAR